MTAAAIILAAGRGTRMGEASPDKLFVELAGRPVLAWTLLAFERAATIEQIVVSTRPDCLDRVAEIARAAGIAKPLQAVVGGQRRQDSVAAGLARLERPVEVVSVHDAARPLVRPDEIDAGVRLAHQHGAVVLGAPVVDTIKRVAPDGQIVATPPRAELIAALTPQTFLVELLRRAHAASGDDATDDAALVERLGLPVHVHPGSRRNIKITTPEDLIVAEAFLLADR
jgi:2-C-methyl-D-erythritol 4-phosphate cytidylyltransferase